MSSNSSPVKQDAYAQIAQNALSTDRSALTTPHALKDLKKSLKTSPCSTLIRSRSDHDLLQNDLSSLEKKFAPFLQSHSQLSRFNRPSTPIPTFHFLLESQTLTQTKSLLEIWSHLQTQRIIEIPHYQGPVGIQRAWYSQEILLNANHSNSTPWLCFKGVDYRCRVYWNEHFVGEHEGFFAPFEFSLENFPLLEKNHLLIEVLNDTPALGYTNPQGVKYPDGDKIYAGTGCGWDDPEVGWHHCPPGMGVYQKVFIEYRSSLFIEDIYVRTLNLNGEIEVWIDLYSIEQTPQSIEFALRVEGENFKTKILINQNKQIPKAGRFNNRYKIPLKISQPRHWTPDSPYLYALTVTLFHDHKPVDTFIRIFGVRTFELKESESPKGRFYLNGTELRLRGANTMGYEQQSVMKEDWKQVVSDLLLAKATGMNFLRITQRPIQSEFYDYCDRLGVMIQTDFPLFGYLRRPQFCEAIRQVQEMARLVRSHPCHILYSYINEPFPLDPEGMKKYNHTEDRSHRQLVNRELRGFFIAATEALRIDDPDSPIKPVDGDYCAPNPGLPDNHCYTLWYNGHELMIGDLIENEWIPTKQGWNYACGEFGAEGLDSMEVINNNYPRNWLPQVGSSPNQWNPQKIISSQSNQFQPYFFERPQSLKEWVESTQEHQAKAIQLMTEAFRRDSRMVSFAIHLFIDAFPSGWMKTIVDCRRNPKLAFFSYKRALQPILPQIRFRKFSFESQEKFQESLWICNDTHESFQGEIYFIWKNSKSTTLFSGKTIVQVKSFKNESCGLLNWNVPKIEKAEKTELHLILKNIQGKIISENRYTLSIYPKNLTATLPYSLQLVATNPKKYSFLKIKPNHSNSSSLILCDNWTLFQKKKEVYEKKINEGAKLILFSLPLGSFDLAGKKIVVEKISMGDSLIFLSRSTGDPSVQNILPNDFGYFQDRHTTRLSALTQSLFYGEGVTPILLHKEHEGINLLGAGRWKYGQGEIILSQVRWDSFHLNPPMMQWIADLLLDLNSLNTNNKISSKGP